MQGGIRQHEAQAEDDADQQLAQGAEQQCEWPSPRIDYRRLRQCENAEPGERQQQHDADEGRRPAQRRQSRQHHHRQVAQHGEGEHDGEGADGIHGYSPAANSNRRLASSTVVAIIQPPSIRLTTPTAMSLGMNVNVISWTCVTTCRIEITRPTTSVTSRIGAATLAAANSVSDSKCMAVSASMP